MKITPIIASLIALVASTQITSAAHYYYRTFQDHDSIWTRLVAWDQDTSNDSYTGEFNILNDGYNPHHYQVFAAKAYFHLGDDSKYDPAEIVEIDLNFGGEEFQTFGQYEIDLSDYVGGRLNGSARIQLSETGIINYTVTATTGDVKLKSARLKAYAKYRPKSVPDGGGTLALLGVNLLGFALLRKKFRRG